LSKIKLTVLPGLVFVLLLMDTYGVMYDANIYKSMALYLLLPIVAVIAGFYVKKTSKFLIEALLFLSLPLLATLPGLLLSGDESINLTLGHELSLHLALMLWLFFLVSLLKSYKDIDAFINFISFGILYVVVVGFVGVDMIVEGEILKSTFGNKNYYANFLLLFVPLLFILSLPLTQKQDGKGWKLEWSNWDRRRQWLFSAALLGIVALFYTQTRSAIVGFIVAMAVVGWFMLYQLVRDSINSGSIKITLFRWFMGALFLMVVIFGVTTGVLWWLDSETIETSRFLNLINWDAWASRLVAWGAAWDSFLAAPWFGWGVGSSYALFFKFLPADFGLYTSIRNYDHVHNEWLELLQEGGVLGLSVYLLVIIVISIVVVKVLRDPRQILHYKLIVLGAATGLGGYLFHSSFSLATRMTVNEFGFYTLVGLILMSFLQSRSPISDKEIELTKDELNSKDNQDVIYLGVPSYGVIGVIITVIWLSSWSTLEQSYYRATMWKIPSSDGEEWRRHVDRSIENGGVKILNSMMSESLARRDLVSTVKLIDRLEERVAGFGSARLIKAITYQFEAGANLDVTHFKKLLQSYQNQDYYHSLVIHWMVRIAAWEQDDEEFLKQINYRLQYHLLSEKLVSINSVDDIDVVIKDELNGMLLEVLDDKVILNIDKKFFYRLRDNLTKINNKSQADELLNGYTENVFVKFNTNQISDYEKKRIISFFEKIVVDLSHWTMVPSYSEKE